VGSEAVGRLAALYPRSRLLGRFISLPGMRVLARWVYGFVARHRKRLGGPKATQK
jgi:predicted DCC family thiol-disulfide oxidoreductase YuxK